MIDLSFLKNNLEGESVVSIVVITTLISFILSLLIALVYKKTNKELDSPEYFIQSLIIISIPVATVMQAIGDSLARGLGILGALTIIRFRTVFKNPRNIVFMFASITVGIAAGVYGITIAIVGTLGFCLAVIIVYFSYSHKTDAIIFILHFEITNSTLLKPGVKKSIEKIIFDSCEKNILQKYNIVEKNTEKKSIFEYEIKVINTETAVKVVDELSQVEELSNIKINFKESNEKI